MSSPTSRPPIDPSDWAPRATRERIAKERLSTAAKSDLLHSPYAPSRTPEHAGAERPSSANALPTPSHAPAQTEATDTATVEKPSGDASIKDVDLARLEDSLRWLQRQEAAYRLPRIAPLPLMPGLTPPDTPRYNREERRAKSLEPELMPPPPATPRRSYLRATLALFITSIVMAAAGYYAGQTGWWPATVQVAALSPTAAPASVAARASRPILARDDDPDTLRASEASDRARGVAQLATLSERSAMAMAPADEPETQIPAGRKAPRGLNADEIKLLVKQGEQFASAGDLVSARVVLQRAAQAGDITAAVALGATYDPVVHARIGAIGLGTDIEQARSWYQKAEVLGSLEATRRLQALANR